MFSLVKTGSQHQPEYMRIDPASGIVTLIDPMVPAFSEDLTIIISTIGGMEPVIQQTRSLTFYAECTPLSTIVTPPPEVLLDHPINVPVNSETMKYMGQFVSANPRCPITSVVIDPNGALYYSLHVDYQNNLLSSNALFRITLKPQYYSSVGSYPYTLTGTASGGATETQFGSFVIEAAAYRCEDAVASRV